MYIQRKRTRIPNVGRGRDDIGRPETVAPRLRQRRVVRLIQSGFLPNENFIRHHVI